MTIYIVLCECILYMELMKSKNNQALLRLLDIALFKLQCYFKRENLACFLQKLKDFSIKVYKYSGRQSHHETQWFLRADKFTPDMTKNILVEDTQAMARTCGFSSSKKSGSFKRLNQRGSVKFTSSSFSHPRRTIARYSSQLKTPVVHQALLPLETLDNNSDDEIKEEDQVINNFREQKTRRQEYKNKLMLAERAEIFKLIDKSITGFILNPMKLSKKKEKIQQMDHFINMDVSVREPQNTPPQKLKKVSQKLAKGHQAKTDRSGGKSHPVSLHLANDHFQELKHEQKIYLLNVPNELKLSPGVTLRENQKHSHNIEGTTFCGTTRKKLQFLKNEEINPVKIKMSELMSFKKITTSTNLAYCSSMKTVKDLPKDGTQSKISIDSKQFVQQPSGSKKLIKIANRKIYQQLLIDLNEQAAESSLKKGKIKQFKSKKEGKVRFDNMAQS